MKQTPILFTAQMVLAILEGRKTQTRRIVKPQPSHIEWFEHQKGFIGSFGDDAGSRENPHRMVPCPYGQEGDRLWVRETWGLMTTPHEWEKWVVYQSDRMAHRTGIADDETVHHRPIDRLDEWTPRMWTGDDPKWRSPYYMPRWASRITLEVTGVRVERLDDITENDAMAEGVPEALPHPNLHHLIADGWQWLPYKTEFRGVWEDINGPGSWEVNPWVWVVEFKRVQEGGEA